MINDLLRSVSTIYIAYGVTDFRKQIHSLCDIVQSKYKLNPYKKEAFIFCNKKRTSIRVLCYDYKCQYINEQKIKNKNVQKRKLCNLSRFIFYFFYFVFYSIGSTCNINNMRVMQ